MINHGKWNVLGVNIDALDYESAVARIVESAKMGTTCTTTALAVHGLITGCLNAGHRFRLNTLDLIVPDGQPVRWALNMLYGLDLRDRVYGPVLTLRVCEAAGRSGVPVYFYGSRAPVLEALCSRLKLRCAGLTVAGSQPSKFRQLSRTEFDTLAAEIKASGAQILFVGLGCPRQEVFAYEMAGRLNMPILAVGAAFDYHAGMLQEPPEILQRVGLQWLFRLCQEPQRLWRRYMITNSQFVVLLLLQLLHVWKPSVGDLNDPPPEMLYG
ncbi:MAG TPA: WecB/TagA/CpsF family glycosyltransferase [Bryobacteraceae bacterium]|jgi:exopolysaccharide biosynthesis WecB/TagA/CpsF family protein|nr:WecB/TagA/CpsF family glycosyltransferase [Bryobacteraceae bacterium]